MYAHIKGICVLPHGGKLSVRSEGGLSPIERMIWNAVVEEFPKVAEDCDKLVDGKLCMISMEECSPESCPKLPREP